MAIEIKVPDIGADKVDVTEVLVKVGDAVTENQSLITVEGDKASMEIPSPQAGLIKEIKVKVGDNVETGSLIMIFDAADAALDNNAKPEAGSNAETLKPNESNQSANTPTAAVETSSEQSVTVPDIGDDAAEVTEILVKVGDSITEEQPLITVEGDKASMEIPAPFAGTVKAISVKTGDKVNTGSTIMTFSVTGTATGKSAAATENNVNNKSEHQDAQPNTAQAETIPKTADNAEADGFAENNDYAHATPVVRRLAREFGVNLAKVKGTGRKGRILREDVQNYVKDLVKRVESGAASGSLPGLLPWPKVDFSKFGTIEQADLSRIQKLSGANLHRNWVMIPHVTQFDEADITELEQFRKQQNSDLAKRKDDLKITPLVFIMKAVAKALEAMPRFNSSLSEDGQTLTLKKYVNIGVAVDTPNGLVVPVLRDVNKKGLVELSRELTKISQTARAGKLTTSDMQGGCFTISSLGGIGGTAFTPIVNAPEVAILGVSKSSMKPVWNGSEFEPRLMLPLSLSYDHRVIDGADGARFISYVNSVLSDIRQLIM